MKLALTIGSTIAVVMCAGTLFSQQETTGDAKAGQQIKADVVASFNYYVPGHKNAYDEKVYDKGYGGEIQARFWPIEYVGFAVAAGGASWNVEDRGKTFYTYVNVYNRGRYLGRYTTSVIQERIGGDVALFPLGGSIIVRPIHIDRVSLTLEGGIRYVFVNAQVDYEASYADYLGNKDYIKTKYDFANGVVGVVGANLEVKIVNPLFVFIGAGYQFDISKGKITIPGMTGSVDNELKAFYGKVGLGLAF